MHYSFPSQSPSCGSLPCSPSGPSEETLKSTGNPRQAGVVWGSSWASEMNFCWTVHDSYTADLRNQLARHSSSPWYSRSTCGDWPVAIESFLKVEAGCTALSVHQSRFAKNAETCMKEPCKACLFQNFCVLFSLLRRQRAQSSRPA